MARALTAGELTHYRKDGQRTKLYLAAMSPAEIATCQLSATPSSDDQVVQISIKSWAWGSGYTSAPKDLLIYVGTAAGGYDKGMVRLREDLSGTPTTIDIGETSEIDWAVDDHITIVEEFNLHPRHVFIDSSYAVFMDYDVTYSDQHENPDPVPVLGPTIVPVWLTEASVDVDWDSGDSWVLGGSITGHSWSAPGASATSGMATSTPTITYDTAGTYRVSCTVTADNGSTFTGYRYVLVYDSNNMPISDVIVESCSGDRETGGWSCKVSLHDDADLTTIRDRSMVALFAEDWYGDTKISIGPIENRETLVLFGWVAGETIDWDAEEGLVSFEIQGPHHWLSKQEGFPSGLESVSGTPSAWTEMQTLTLRKGLWHFLHWRTTATRILDVNLTSDATEIAIFNAAQGTLWDQIVSEAWATILAKPCCDRFGRVYVEKEPNLVPTGDRSAWPTVHTITTDDFTRPLSIERSTIPKAGMVDLSGIVYDVSGGSGDALFSLSPGHIPKWYGPIEGFERLALTSQAQSNTLAGLVLAWRNNEYPSVPVAFASNHRMFDICPHQQASLSIVSGDTKREIAETLTLYPNSVSFEYDISSGSFLTTVDFEASIVDTVSADGDIPETPPDQSDPPVIPDPIPTPPTGGTGEVVIVATIGDPGVSGAGVCYTLDARSGNPPTWYQLNTGLSDHTAIESLAMDPSRPSTHLACIDYSGDVFVNTNWRGGGSWSSALTESDVLADFTGASDVDIVYVYSKDYGGTPYLFVVAQLDYGGVLYDQTVIYISTDWGTTWIYEKVVYGSWSVTNCSKERGYDEQSSKWWIFKLTDSDLASDSNGGIVLSNEFLIINGRIGSGALTRPNVARYDMNLESWDEPCNVPNSCDQIPACSEGTLRKGIGGKDSTYWREHGGGICLKKSGVDAFHVFRANSEDTPSEPLVLCELSGNTNNAGTEITEGPGWGIQRGMLAPPPSDSSHTYLALMIDGTDTKVYVDSVASATTTITGEFRKVYCFPSLVDGDALVYLGRSCVVAEKAESGEPLVMLSERPDANIADSFQDISGGSGATGLYSLGARGISELFVDTAIDR